MAKGDPFKRAFLSVMFMFVVFLSYRPIQTEIHAMAINASTTNAVLVFTDAWFGIFWALLAIFFLGVAVYNVILAMG